MSRIRRYKPNKGPRSGGSAEKWLTTKKLWTIILAGLMVVSVFGIMLSSYSSTPEKQKYGKYVFQRTSQGWTINVNDKAMLFHHHPLDVENLDIDDAVPERIRDSKVIYITFNPSDRDVETSELMRYELGGSLEQIFGIYPMAGVTVQNETYPFPVVTCQNATAMVPVIQITNSDKPDARLNGNCIILEADDNTAMLLTDRILYGMMGILEEKVPEDTGANDTALDGE